MRDQWEKAFAKLTYGIYVLTSRAGEAINGMIASWVSQVSYDPPLVMVAVHPKRYSNRLIEQGHGFVLNVLSGSQTDYLSRFKGSDPQAKFSSLKWTTGQTGSPILSECLAYLECELKTVYRPGNHSLFIGQVVDAAVFADGQPLGTWQYEGTYLGKD